MMMTFLVVSVAVTMIQTAGAYLRYLPFSSEISPEEKNHLWQILLTWAIFSVSLNFVVISGFEMSAPLYKVVMFFGWLPYFLISVCIIKRPFSTHIFVLGMQCIWAIILHTAAIMVERFADLSLELEHLFYTHAVVYLLLFLVLLPVERAVFKNLLPSFRIFSATFRWPMSLLPMIIFIGVSLPIADDLLVHDWRYSISRLGLPIAFFFIYRAMSIATNQAEQYDNDVQESLWMRQQIDTLKEYDALREKSNQEMLAISHELYESYVLLDKYLAANDIKAAIKHIEAQEGRLVGSPLKLYSDFPLVNAALSIYVNRAEKLGIVPNVKIDLPKDMSTDERDFAALLSNLLENAVEAEEKQPAGRRFLSVVVSAKEGKCSLEIVNLSDSKLVFGKNGMPFSAHPERGVGTAFLTEFIQKYDADIKFTQENGRVQVSMNWTF